MFPLFHLLSILLLLFFLLQPVSAYASAPDSHPCDTLFKASTANRITIEDATNTISVTAYKVNGSLNNYYYLSSSPGKNSKRVIYDNINGIHDITVCESPKEVIITYLTSEDKELAFAFPIPNPRNRTVKSYVGTKDDDFGLSLPLTRSSNPSYEGITENLINTTRISWDAVSGGWYVGMNTPTNSDVDMHTRMGHSWEFGWLNMVGVKMKYGYNALSLGVGLGWRWLGTDHNYYFTKNEETGRLSLLPFEGEKSHCSSSLNLFTIHVPLLYELRFGHGRHCKLHLGPVLNFNTGGSIHASYQVDDNSYKVKTRSIGQRPVTLDGFLGLSWKGMGLYVRYSPMTTFKPYTGFDYKPLSTGIYLLL